MSTALALQIFGGLAALGLGIGWWCWMEETFERTNSDAVRDLRRSYVERRLGIERRASPPPLWPHKERRKGQRRLS